MFAAWGHGARVIELASLTFKETSVNGQELQNLDIVKDGVYLGDLNIAGICQSQGRLRKSLVNASAHRVLENSFHRDFQEGIPQNTQL